MDHHRDRLADDHANARLLAAAVRDHAHLKLTPADVDTNVVWAEVAPALGTARDVAGRLKDAGVLAAPLGGQLVRFVTHLDVSRSDCEQAAAAVRAL